MHILKLSGTPLERGRVHGEQLRNEIREQIDWFRNLLQEYGQVKPDDIFARVPGLGWLAAIERWTPHLLDEMRGIAEGSGLPYLDILSWNHCQEIFWAVFSEHSFPQSGYTLSGCSTLGDIGDSQHPTILAQNADTTIFWHGHQTILRFCEGDSDVEEILLSYPGLIGIYGMNSQGIGLCVNAMFYRLNNSLRGLGTPFIGRAVLAKRSYQEAELFLHSVTHASANTLTLGGPGSVTAYEVSANQIRPFRPPSQPGRTYHTNHEMVNDDFRSGVDRAPDQNSLDRLKVLQEMLALVKNPLTVSDVKTILRSHGENIPLCRHEDDPYGSMTTYSIIMECSNRPALHVSFGPPCREEYQTFDF
jgi:isopenicillin-N N-acyltransferase like protein